MRPLRRMDICRTDGGRAEDGFFREKSDCVVRAVAVAHNMPYKDAHELLSLAGRKDGRGTFRYQMKDLLGEPSGSGGTVQRFLLEHPKGNFIVRVTRHAFAVRDGIVYDSGSPGAGQHVKDFWTI